VCLFVLLAIFQQIKKRNVSVIFLGEMDAFALLYIAEIWGLHIRSIGVCGYGYIDEYPRKICGYGYGREISYPWQAWC